MVDAVTIGALNRIIRNNSLGFKVSGGTIENTPIGMNNNQANTNFQKYGQRFVGRLSVQ